jgi:predicted HTH transcriptional regulator
MFGYDYEIVREFPNYFLDYQERMDESTRWTDRLNSGTGDWSGNLYDFYFRVYNKLTQDVKVPFKLKDGRDRVDDTPIHEALREALANCLINADYHGRQGVVVIRGKDGITLSNPGGFRIDIRDAVIGGVSDPRNTTLIKMFNLINVGERSGSGIPKIFAAWEGEGWRRPELKESFEPDRTCLSLEFASEKVAIKSSDKKAAIKNSDKRISKKTKGHREKIMALIDERGEISTAEACRELGLQVARVRRILRGMVDESLIKAEGGNKNRRYRAK